MAQIVKKTEFVGVGCLVQLVGVVCCFIAFPYGIFPGLVLLVIGGRLAIVRKCSECIGKVDKRAKVCQHCGAKFNDELFSASEKPEKERIPGIN